MQHCSKAVVQCRTDTDLQTDRRTGAGEPKLEIKLGVGVGLGVGGDGEARNIKIWNT